MSSAIRSENARNIYSWRYQQLAANNVQARCQQAGDLAATIAPWVRPVQVAGRVR